MSNPMIQIDGEIREMTDDEFAEYKQFYSGWADAPSVDSHSDPA